MGLDVWAFSKVEWVAPCPTCGHVAAADDLDEIEPGDFDRLGSVVPGTYRLDDAADAHVSMSYGGYNRWRELLAGMLGTTPGAVWAAAAAGAEPPIPFVELIHFTDC